MAEIRYGYNPMPPLNTDVDAEAFLKDEDLSEYDWSGFRMVGFKFNPQTEETNHEHPVELATIDSTELKQMPLLSSDEEAEDFVANADLSEYDLPQFKKIRYEFETKTRVENFELPNNLVVKLKEKVETLGLTYNQFVTQVLEQAISQR